VVSRARGLNDTPKIVALLLAVRAVAPRPGLALVGGAMAIGGIVGARRVAETLSKKIVAINAGQGFVANAVTGALVVCASLFGLPVSTTHVATGALFGIGLSTGGARARTVLMILLAWVTTLPLGAALGAAARLVLG
jgi:PiT family inorganic phosphate transporter